MRHWIRAGAFLLISLSAGCDQGGEGTAAEAGDHELTVDDVATLLAPVTELPNEAGVIETLIEFWIDYTLLASAVNEEGTLEELDIAALVELERSRQIVLRLRDRVIQVDTAISDAELTARFEEERPGEEIRARHILLSIPPGAPQTQEDSVRGLAEELRDRARGGEDFAALAEQYSDDTGSAVQGGDLGFFGRGMMVPPFEEAAFALDPGEVSDVVRSDFGFHVIRLEERRTPALADIATDYRAQMIAERNVVAESIYLADIEGPANVQLTAGAADRVRAIATDPETELSGGDAGEPLATYVGGDYTQGRFREFMLTQTPDIWQQVAAGTDEQIGQMLRELTRDRILIVEAESQGIEITAEEEAEIASQVREQYVLIADFLGVDSLQVAEGDVSAAVDAEVDSLMVRLVTNQQDIIPLGPLARPLREHYGTSVEEEAVERIMARIVELRGPGAAAPPAATPPAPLPTTPAPEGGAGAGP